MESGLLNAHTMLEKIDSLFNGGTVAARRSPLTNHESPITPPTLHPPLSTPALS